MLLLNIAIGEGIYYIFGNGLLFIYRETMYKQ